VGTISLVLVEKNETSIWTGKLTLHGKEYSIYILEGKRQFQRNELKEKVREYCDERDENCVKIAKGIGNRFCEKVYDQSCREKISEFCEQNPDDPRCRAIAKNFCANNTEDIRCRDLLKEVCKTTPNDPRCLEYCEQNPELCKIHIKTEIKEKIRERLQRTEETRRVNKAMVQER
ncbi:MAG: hypothetical protein NZ893_00505, partial [Candidatus Aenigmarchaeota archaeon]|nr:hypothetical protein [Candidatus Aenigmarchaeota archaeon]